MLNFDGRRFAYCRNGKTRNDKSKSYEFDFGYNMFLEMGKMILNEKILTSFLNKEVRVETTRNSFLEGIFRDWEKNEIIIEKRITIEPFLSKSFNIDRFIIKTIKLLEPEEKKEPETKTAFFEKFEEKKND
jgi:hypothetical protein